MEYLPISYFYIYHKFKLNVGIKTIHGWYGHDSHSIWWKNINFTMQKPVCFDSPDLRFFFQKRLTDRDNHLKKGKSKSYPTLRETEDSCSRWWDSRISMGGKLAGTQRVTCPNVHTEHSETDPFVCVWVFDQTEKTVSWWKRKAKCCFWLAGSPWKWSLGKAYVINHLTALSLFNNGEKLVLGSYCTNWFSSLTSLTMTWVCWAFQNGNCN